MAAFHFVFNHYSFPQLGNYETVNWDNAKITMMSAML